jgi:hypothetical protein
VTASKNNPAKAGSTRGTVRGNTTAGRKPPSKRPAAAKSGADDDGGNGRVRSDQFGAIFAKGLDLAEASLSLGLTMITRVGAAAQNQIERMASVLPQEPPPAVAPEPPARPAAPPPEAAGPITADERQYGIGNRQPVTQGGVVRISFSINNDSVSTPKNVTLQAADFVGELEGTRIEAERFSVKPQRRRIAPLDFEKFVLEGAIPPDVPSDIYHGAVVVSSGQAFSIPVRLVVQGT